MSTSKTREQRIARAAEHLSAVELTGGRWAYRDDSTQLWYVLGADELAELCDYLDHADPAIRRDAYSHWCATGESGDEMPRGWTPPDAARLARQLYRDDLSRADEVPIERDGRKAWGGELAHG